MTHTKTPMHTPTPWAFNGRTLITAGSKGLHVAYVATTGMGNAIEANAALIVRAVNSHAELVSALEEYLGQYTEDEVNDAPADSIRGKCRDALSKARGG